MECEPGEKLRDITTMLATNIGAGGGTRTRGAEEARIREVNFPEMSRCAVVGSHSSSVESVCTSTHAPGMLDPQAVMQYINGGIPALPYQSYH